MTCISPSTNKVIGRALPCGCSSATGTCGTRICQRGLLQIDPATGRTVSSSSASRVRSMATSVRCRVRLDLGWFGRRSHRDPGRRQEREDPRDDRRDLCCLSLYRSGSVLDQSGRNRTPEVGAGSFTESIRPQIRWSRRSSLASPRAAANTAERTSPSTIRRYGREIRVRLSLGWTRQRTKSLRLSAWAESPMDRRGRRFGMGEHGQFVVGRALQRKRLGPTLIVQIGADVGPPALDRDRVKRPEARR